jgi:hypothetical protein
MKLTNSSSFKVARGRADVKPALRFVAAIVCNEKVPLFTVVAPRMMPQ